MELRHFKLIVAVAKLGSLTKASSELFLSQPALSHQLKEIEEELGVKIFKRENNKMILTDIGQIVESHSQESLNVLDSLYKSLNEQEYKKNSIRVCLQNYNSYHWIGGIIEDFNSRYKDIDIEIVTESTRNPLELLSSNELDLAVMYKCPLDPKFVISRLLSDELVAVLNSEHELANKDFLNPKDLENEVMILNTSKGESEPLINQLINLNSIQFKKTISMNSTDNIVHMIRSGLGISILPKWVICPFASSDIKCLQITDSAVKAEWHLVLRNESLNPELSYFAQLIKTTLNRNQPKHSFKFSA